MLLLLPAAMVLFQPPPSDGLLAARIRQLADTAFSDGDNNQESVVLAGLTEIFTRGGLPTISAVGDQAAYTFVFLACSPDRVPFYRRVLYQARSGAKRGEIPAHAASYCDAHVRDELVKAKAAKRPPANTDLKERIEGLYQEDQAVRERAGFDSDRMARTDADLSAGLEAIFQRHGVPTYRLVDPGLRLTLS